MTVLGVTSGDQDSGAVKNGDSWPLAVHVISLNAVEKLS